jgi:hypothetical protein
MASVEGDGMKAKKAHWRIQRLNSQLTKELLMQPTDGTIRFDGALNHNGMADFSPVVAKMPLTESSDEAPDQGLLSIQHRLGDIGDDFEGSPEEVARTREQMRFDRMGRSVGIRLDFSESINLQWARRLLSKCVDQACPVQLRELLVLGYPLDLGNALLSASRNGMPECAKILAAAFVDAGGNSNATKDPEGHAPLVSAVISGNVKTAAALLPHSDMAPDSHEGEAALDIAMQRWLRRYVTDGKAQSFRDFPPLSDAEIISTFEAWIERAQLRLEAPESEPARHRAGRL